MDLITESLGIMMSGEQEIPDVPDGYEQLDYVVCPSSGQAGFEITGYTPIQYDLHECKTSPYKIPTGSTSAQFAGTQDNYADYYQVYYNIESKITIYTKNSAASAKLPARDVVVNGTYISRFEINKTLTNNARIGYRVLGNIYKFNGAIYYYKIWRLSNDSENTLIYDFVPAKRVSDDKIGMYEKVNGVFYPSTTGTDFQAPTAE